MHVCTRDRTHARGHTLTPPHPHKLIPLRVAGAQLTRLPGETVAVLGSMDPDPAGEWLRIERTAASVDTGNRPRSAAHPRSARSAPAPARPGSAASVGRWGRPEQLSLGPAQGLVPAVHLRLASDPAAARDLDEAARHHARHAELALSACAPLARWCAAVAAGWVRQAAYRAGQGTAEAATADAGPGEQQRAVRAAAAARAAFDTAAALAAALQDMDAQRFTAECQRRLQVCSRAPTITASCLKL